MNFVQEFLEKFDEYDEEAANAIAKEFQDKPEYLMELFSHFRDVENYVSLIMSKMLDYNTGIVDKLIDITSEEKLDQVLEVLDDSILDFTNVDQILNRTRENKRAIIKTVRSVVNSRPKYPIEPTIEESMNKYIEDRDVVFDLLSSIPRERQTDRMITLSINGYGEYAFSYIDTNHLGEYQKKYRDTLGIINEWSEHTETQTPLGFAKTIDKLNSQEIVYPRVYDDLLAGTKHEVINDKNARLFFNSKYKGQPKSKIAKMSNKYSYLLANNDDLNEWIDLDLMLADNDIPEEAILEMSKHGMDSTDEFGDLIKSFGDEAKASEESQVSEEDTNKMVNIVTSPYNYFEVQNMDDVRNYESRKKEKCMSILYGDEGKNLLQRESWARRYRIDEENLNKFAILEILYGTDFESAKGLIDKYGKNIGRVRIDTEEDKKYVGFLNGINSIMSLDEAQVDRALQDNGFKDLLQKCDSSKMPSSSKADSRYKELYSSMYREGIFDVNGEVTEGKSLTHGKNVIRVVDIKPGPEKPIKFAMVVGSDENHENYITQSMLAVSKDTARPILGYTNFDTVEFKEEYVTPEQLLSETRSGANKIKVRKNRRSLKDPVIKPSFIALFKEKNADDLSRFETQNFLTLSGGESERLMDDKVRFDNSKHLAATLGLPIVVVDREAIAVQETSKLNNRLIGMSKPSDIVDTIILFENNRNGMEDSEYLKTNYFTDDDRSGMVKSIFRFIDEKVDDDKKKEAYTVFRDALLDEQAKYSGINLEVGGNMQSDLTVIDEPHIAVFPPVYEDAIEILDDILMPSGSKLNVSTFDGERD